MKRAVVTGNFDGCHRGHSALFAQLRREASARGLDPLVVSFTPHTRHVLSPDSGLKLLTVDEEKRELLLERFDLPLLLLPFDEAMRTLSRENFLTEIIRDRIGASFWLMGENHRFGRGGAGDFAAMAAFAQSRGVELAESELVESQETVVSSSRIRSLIEEGRMREAKELLGYPYRLSGTVVPGAQRGRNLGAPTANVAAADGKKLFPPAGVYAGRVLVRGERIDAIAHLGGNPTFGVEEHRLEVHLLDWSGDLYGERLLFAVEARIRGTIRFGSAEELKRQIADDLEICRAVLRG